MRALEHRNLLLGVCGGIAAYKAAWLARALVRAGAHVTPCLTGAATRFVTPLTFEALCGRPCLTDDDFFARGEAIAHVEAARACDGIVIAPATANTIARIACGLADNLLCSIVLASRAPVLLVPSMHTAMWENPITRSNVARLPSDRFRVLPPETGDLASGDKGAGRFPDIEAILDEAAHLLSPHDLDGRRVVVTGGPTREHLDPVRVLTNPSSGRMGIALARAAAIRGASACLILGPTEVRPPSGPAGRPVEVVRVETTAEMADAVRSRLSGADALLMAAAPADEAPSRPSLTKVRKEDLPRTLDLRPTPDILASLPRPRGLVTLGFAAETGDPAGAGRKKRRAKRLDLLFANPVGAGSGFGTPDNEGVLLGPDGEEEVPRMAKEDLADLLLDRVSRLLARRPPRTGRPAPG